MTEVGSFPWIRRALVRSEGAFTRSRTECPHPERWHTTGGQSTELEVTSLIAAMVTALQPDFVLETGTFVGNTTEAIGRALHANGQGTLVSLDVNPECVAIARSRCVDLPVTVLAQSSMEYEPDRPIDFAFFDSLTRLRALEFERFVTWMHDRTVVGFHDTGSHHPLRELLHPLAQRGLLVSPLYLPTPRGVMFARVGIPRDA